MAKETIVAKRGKRVDVVRCMSAVNLGESLVDYCEF